MKKIKKYYRIEFELTSPLSIGCGENDITDSDLILDGRGKPYIPGTALAGVYRSLFEKNTADLYFGPDLTEERIQLSSKEGRNILTDSSVLVYDAVLLDSAKPIVASRDMVALDAYKVSVDGAKFDFQVLEPGVTFVTYLEQNMDVDEEKYVLAELVYAWQQKKIMLGAKTGRGYGHTKLVSVSECAFNLNSKKELHSWLDFDMYGAAGWKKCEEVSCLSSIGQKLSTMEKPEAEDLELYKTLQSVYEKYTIHTRACRKMDIVLELQQRSGITVRQYSTNINQADYMQMARKDGVPYIPGTTWAGAFRAQFEKLDKEFGRLQPLTELFFGVAKGKDKNSGYKTRVTFSESTLPSDEKNWRVYTRNAIDRFSGGAVDKSLYTEKSYYNGMTELQISCDMTGLDEKSIQQFCNVLAAAILDLDRGYMAIGGLTSVGHGMFQVKEVYVNGSAVNFTNIDWNSQYAVLRNAMNGKEK